MPSGIYKRKPFTKNHIKKMSIARTGSGNPMFGKTGKKNHRFGTHCSSKTKKKIGDANRGEKNYMFGKIGKKHHLFGTHPTEETRRKIGRASEGRSVGKKNHNWKGGISKENDKIRSSKEHSRWGRSVFIRDNFTCQKTKITGGSLVAHHILNFSSNPELRFDINNGITLSRKSHEKFHRIYGKINNTREQLLEFLKDK